MGELRESKKRETRLRISDVATALFFERGFDAVTVDEIAAAARVSKVTVFNYFPRKEDLHVDREEEVKQIFCESLTNRPKGEAPVDALERLATQLIEARSPYACASDLTARWWSVVAGSPSLQARVRELGDEVAEAIAVQVAGAKVDGAARLFGGMVVLTWRTAYHDALRVLEHGGSEKKARAAFRARIDYGFTGIRALGSS